MLTVLSPFSLVCELSVVVDRVVDLVVAGFFFEVDEGEEFFAALEIASFDVVVLLAKKASFLTNSTYSSNEGCPC